MWFLFLSQETGSNEDVYKTLNKAKTGNVRDAVMKAVTLYESAYAEFALYNWNRKPWKTYMDSPKFPDKHPYGSSKVERDIEDPFKFTYTEQLEKGAMKYMIHVFDNDTEKIRRVRFDFKTPSQDPNVHRQALIKIGDIWHLEDWTSEANRDFCRKKPEENVKSVVLILSNGDQKNKKTVDYSLNTEWDCNRSGTGYMRITASSPLIDQTFYSEDTIEYYPPQGIEAQDSYVITERRMSCSYSYHMEIESIQGPIVTSTTGNGQLTETYTVGVDAPDRFLVDNEDRKDIGLWTDPPTKNKEWVTYTTTGSLGGYIEKGDCETGAPGVLDLKEDEITADGIKGRRTSTEGTATVVIEFEYRFR
jgi:hypothetical protein